MYKMTKSLLSAAVIALTAGLPTMAVDAGLDKSNSTGFALGLFAHEAKDTSKNVLVSPFSAYMALSMCANGADGSTRAAMAKSLGVSGADLDGLNKRNHSLLDALNNNQAVHMEVANAIYADSNTKFKASFIELCQKQYDAVAKTEDFADPETVKKINGWCDQKTHGKIKEIIAKLTPREKMVILNSVYFKGKWDKPFKKEATQERPFHLLSGATKSVPMMHKTLSPLYLQGKGFQAACLPYAGDKQAMYVFLPDKGSDFAAFAGNFTPDNWRKWMGAFDTRKVSVVMPRYKVEFFALLNNALTSVGMGEAFSAKANFSKMFESEEGQISRVLQKTYMDVNEEGTEAAAVTAVVMATRSISFEPPPINFVVDHPFVVALVDQETGEILFLGSIIEPKS